jgi:hypothetical protein
MKAHPTAVYQEEKTEKPNSRFASLQGGLSPLNDAICIARSLNQMHIRQAKKKGP